MQVPAPPLELELDEDELEELLDEELLDELLDEELLDDELELLDELLPQSLTTPPFPHWLSQVLMPIQLWLFSQPQPEFWFWHSGRISPYQLHAVPHWPPVLELLLDELLEELLDELLELELELEELELELEVLLVELLDELDELLPDPPPFTASDAMEGVPEPLAQKPNETLLPGAMVAL